MKCLVTGGAGFIGSSLVDELVNGGFGVIVVDNLSTGFKEYLNPGAKFYNADICDGDKLKAIFEKEKPDYVHHLAAQMDVRVSTRKPVFDATVNIIGSLNIIMNSAKNKVKKIIYSNTGGALYGEIRPEDLPVKEEHLINPISQYGISKHTAEHYLRLYNYNYGLGYVSLRYPNVYGPRQNPNGEAGVIAIFAGKMLANKRPVIYGNGKQTRDYVYVRDVVDANIAAQESDRIGCYNVGSGKETSVLEIFDMLKKELDFQQEPLFETERLGEIKRICLDNAKIKKEIGWKPKHSIQEGIKKTIQYYKDTYKGRYKDGAGSIS